MWLNVVFENQYLFNHLIPRSGLGKQKISVAAQFTMQATK